MSSSAYLITIGQPDIDGVMSDDFEETLIFVGKTIERLCNNEDFKGKYIYVVKYVQADDGRYIKQADAFSKQYLIDCEN